MLKELDLMHPLGLEHDRKAPLLPFFTSVKWEHPTKVILVRVSSAVNCKCIQKVLSAAGRVMIFCSQSVLQEESARESARDPIDLT